MIDENRLSWVAGKTSLVTTMCSDVQAFMQGEIPVTRANRTQTVVENSERKKFLDFVKSARFGSFSKRILQLSKEVFTTDASNQVKFK